MVTLNVYRQGFLKNGQDSEGPPAFSYQVESNTGEIAGLLDVLSLLTSDANKRRKSHTNNGRCQLHSQAGPKESTKRERERGIQPPFVILLRGQYNYNQASHTGHVWGRGRFQLCQQVTYEKKKTEKEQSTPVKKSRRNRNVHQTVYPNINTGHSSMTTDRRCFLSTILTVPKKTGNIDLSSIQMKVNRSVHPSPPLHDGRNP